MEVVTLREREELETALKRIFGFGTFKGQQKAVVQSILDGKDTFVIMPTGGGKSLCYQLPALVHDGTAIVVSPLIALMKNQVDSIRHHCKDDDIAHFLNSSLNKTESTHVKNCVREGKTKLLYVAPESLNKEENIEFFKSCNISFYAIDEAHCISEWGHDFRPEYRKLRPMIEAIGNVPIMALTATATPKVQQDIQRNLGMTDARLFKASFNRENLFYEVRPKVDEKKQIVQFIKQRSGQSGIIYCLSRKKVEELAELLTVNGINALPYHAGLEGKVRSKHQDMFLMEEADVIVATIAFGMGIDKPDVRFVIHNDIPKSLEGYYQETGRAGRDGGDGHCLAFFSDKDIEKLEKFLQNKPVSEQEVGKQLLVDIVSYAETSVCRRKFILHYFGEEYDEQKCNEHCDSCKNPRERFEGGEYVRLLLETITQLKETQKGNHITHVLTGEANNAVRTFKHDALEVFGQGKDKNGAFWKAVIRQALVHGLITKEIETYGTLKITDKGREFSKSTESITLFKEREHHLASNGEIVEHRNVGQNALDADLFAILKDLRKTIAKDKGIPPYVVFQDPSLSEMCLQYPVNLEELTKISGVGAGKAARYGKPFVQVIAKYVEDKDIQRPQDFVVKSVVNKSGLKVKLINNIDRKLSLEDIADACGKTFDEILNEIEAIVESGTRVDLKYYINELLDDDSQEEIYDYFMESDSDSIDEAINEFGNDFEEDEIRLMRIKFLSEQAN